MSQSDTTNSFRAGRVRSSLAWFLIRIRRTAEWDKGLEGAVAAMFVAAAAAGLIGALSTPTGIGVWFDVPAFTLAAIAACALTSAVLAPVLSLLYVPLPRVLLSASVFTAALVYYIQDEASLGTAFTAIMTGVYILTAYLLGFLFQIWSGASSRKKKVLLSLVPLSWFLFLLLFHPTIDHHSSDNTFDGNQYITPLALEHPGEPGPYNTVQLFYGSGGDRHRDQFNDEMDFVTSAVDASRYVDDGEWPGWRSRFWGFDETAFPLNGEMWLPEGEGPFPLVLIAHGNHRMENFSDEGYTYLGEHLASQGYAAVSIDQNFVNFSNWTGIPDENMRLRAWLFMQHMLELNRLVRDEDHVLSGMLNMEQTTLIGHSRGGQAAAMVPDYERFFEGDFSLSGMEDLPVTSVVGLAPTDQTVDDDRAAPSGVNYLTLHGARDGDVHNFRGDRQYGRTTVEGNEWKAAVYIADANHSQFNTAWGRADMRLPGGMFLSRKQMMEPEDQRAIAKTFITAFLHATVRNQSQYEPLFRDVRYGANWLPETSYVSRFQTGRYNPLVTFNRNNDRSEFPEGVTAEAEGFTEWAKTSTEDRAGNRKAADGVILEWGESGTYRLLLPEEYRESYFSGTEDALTFSMSQMDRELGGDLRGATDPSLEIGLLFEDGGSVDVPLQTYYDIPSAIWTQYSRYPFLEDQFREGKYEEAIEPVFQTYVVPVSLFDGYDPDELIALEFRFGDGPGRMIIDDIGFEQLMD
ncbi:hypothetical protein [Alkalicoccus luteus]|uniref:Alpha/beta hydrolase n=1 Tax=Alkalicoccus luteus TaxID=1237094 RepID=A0A969PR78_9BACI|nr:hypothetical protein [Alkalicoccus luteus]NJP38936.1 hypothetical protein [Alkalicoccus luteus]